MSYSNSDYSNSQGGYGQYNPYGQQQNNAHAGQQQGYGQSPYQQANNMEQGNGNYEMSSMGEGQPSGPTAMLNKCKEINDGIADLRAKREGQLAAAQNALLDSSTGKEDQASRQTLDYIEDEINNGFRYLRDLLKKIKQTPGSGDTRVQTQIDVTSRNLRREIEQYQRAQSDFQKRLREQVRRRYEIANPGLSPEEVEQGVENVLVGQEQSFQVTGSRTRQANDARQAALERSAAIRKIEQDMIELGRLYQEVAELVHQQEPAVEQINRGAEDVVDNVQNANTQIDSAIKSARNARKWKWYALLIIILIIAIVVGVAVGVTQANKSTK
ncbi:syntaxin [Aspergillus clavatus NRRL 1]|uniref:SNARE domain protein n=1 Tax=Aspergillus clavatus (strain ATCC 1007 / CBS 513.65 / DSM 816 / NCTC 3887 / NRRL 1 / QM 1276 / 107) TaxID=344612 RepID=A1CG90_ASPCL|nr:SNARE domain protein [Aspergillus clavatus NRRL 1]EAW10970.1 SNARE domain protein [Aspergillus clavatus NRRL 1]